jgi:PPP family 3-phenylpropionic acid transporter
MGYIVGTLVVPLLTDDLVRLLLIGAAGTAVASLPLLRLRAPKASQRHYVSPELVLRNRALVPLFASLFLFAMASPAYLQFAPIYARELGASTKFIGFFCSMTGFVAVIGLPLTGRLVDRYGTRRLIWIALLTQPVRVAGYGLVAEEYWLLIVPQLLHAFTWAGLEIAGVLYVTRQALPGNQATALAMYAGAQTMGWFVGASVSGYLAQHVSYPMMYLVMAAIASLAIIVFIVASRVAAPEADPRRRPQQQ